MMDALTIQGEKIPVRNDYCDINELKFLKDNPRVYSCIHGDSDFDNFPEGKQQEKIFDALRRESSVKNLLPDIKRNGGLMENILVRWDRKEVIEGNSRLAVYKLLHKDYPDKDWNLIPCDIVKSLTDDQQATFLHQVHVKGKTHWTAYEKANFAYVRYAQSRTDPEIIKKIATLFGVSSDEIRKRVAVIEMMKQNGDAEQTHFSYYDVLVRSRDISRGIEKDPDLKSRLLQDIRGFRQTPSEDDNSLRGDNLDKGYSAQEMRDRVPVILRKPKILKKFKSKDVDMDEAYQLSKISNVQERIRKAKKILEDISKKDIDKLERNDLNALKSDFKQLKRQMKRIDGMVQLKDNSEELSR